MSTAPGLDTFQQAVRAFCAERDWDQYHTAKDLAIGVVTEGAELLEMFRFLTPTQVDAALAEPAFRQRVGRELGDVLFFLVRFSDRFGFDLLREGHTKLSITAENYPVATSRGRNEKYTELR